MRSVLLAWLLLACASVSSAQAAQVPTTATLHVGTPVPLETVAELSSKTSVKGDMVALITSEDVIGDGMVIVPRGTEAVGQIADARVKGAMGMSGRLLVRPLYLRVRGTVVRLSGQRSETASVTAGAVIGTIASRIPMFTGRSATIPAGTHLTGVVEKAATIPAPE